ncbi:MAG: AAA family ATPase [Candidatus Micrarchaeaceae archaeon]
MAKATAQKIQYNSLPLALYSLKDKLSVIASRPSFFDMLLIAFAFFIVNNAVPFYPLLIFIIILAGLVILSLYHPFIGTSAFAIAIIPPIMYQAPLIAVLYIFALVITFFFGYMHYRTILFMYTLIALSFSFFGYLFSLLFFALAIIVVGRKRAIIITILFVLAVASLSGLTGMQNSSYILYNSTYAANELYSSPLSVKTLPLMETSKNATSLQNFSIASTESLSRFGGAFYSYTSSAIDLSILALFAQKVPYYLLQLLLLIVVVVFIDSFTISSRSAHKGTISVAITATYLLIPVALSNFSGFSYILSYPYSMYMIFSAIISPLVAYIMEINGIHIVRSLDVRKQDIRLKFGDTFEDMQVEQSNESFDDIGDYTNVKKELIDSVINPTEEKAIAQAYGIKPTHGILLFGPPGTGKTMMMRAVAHEIHSPFYYVKTANLLSPYSGTTAKAIQNIFAIARKHQPCVLFFDEIDAIAGLRETAQSQSLHEALTQLLVEMDGFQKSNNIIVIGATNVPNLIDPALLRPGRFDKIIYMPLPDVDARKKIFDIYLKKFPLSDAIDLDLLAQKTERYSGSDIKSICTSVAQSVAEEAIAQHKVIKITQDDILKVISSTKPSTSLAQIEKYNLFKLDFERSVSKEAGSQESKPEISLEEVIGLDEAKKALVDAIQIPLMHPDLVEKYALKSIKGVLLFGPPGVGKTMLMKAALSDPSLQGTTMLELNGAEIASAPIDKAVAAIKENFNRARENQPSILFIDEIDGLAPIRKEGIQSSQLTTTLLSEMDGISKSYGVVVVAATNKPDAIDPALLRPGRFDKLVFVKPPNAEQRIQLFKSNLKGVPVLNIDFDKLSEQTKGYTGADISNICREVKSLALEKSIKAGKEIPIEMEDFAATLSKIRPSAPQSVLNQYLSFLANYGQR